MKGLLSTGGQNMKLSKKKYYDLPFKGSGDSRCKRNRGPAEPSYPVTTSWRTFPPKDRTVQVVIIWFLFLLIISFGVISAVTSEKDDKKPIAPIEKIQEKIRGFFY